MKRLPKGFKLPDVITDEFREKVYAEMTNCVWLCEPYLDYVAKPPPERDINADIAYTMRRYKQALAFLRGPGKNLTVTDMVRKRLYGHQQPVEFVRCECEACEWRRRARANFGDQQFIWSDQQSRWIDTEALPYPLKRYRPKKTDETLD